MNPSLRPGRRNLLPLVLATLAAALLGSAHADESRYILALNGNSHPDSSAEYLCEGTTSASTPFAVTNTTATLSIESGTTGLANSGSLFLGGTISLGRSGTVPPDSLSLAPHSLIFPEDSLTFSDADGTLSLNPVPEPSTYLLLALAAVGVWFLRRLRWV